MQERSAEPEAASDAVSRVMALALRFTGEHEAAEEVVMDIYLQVWRQWDRYSRARGKVMAWIFTICRSRALDWLRRRDPAETHADPYALGIEPCTDSDPLDALVGLEARGRMAKALRGLTRVERQLLSMVFFRGLTHEEVVGTSNGTRPPFCRIAEVYFPSLQVLQARVRSDGGRETVAHAIKISSGGTLLVAEELTLGSPSVWDRLKALVSPR
jgi:RNA polymerase sigma factor (sigma-70 family)